MIATQSTFNSIVSSSMCVRTGSYPSWKKRCHPHEKQGKHFSVPTDAALVAKFFANESNLGSCCFGPLNNLWLHHNAYVCKAHVMFYSFLQLPLKYLFQVKHFRSFLPLLLPFEIGYRNKDMTRSRSRLQELAERLFKVSCDVDK